jgi:hypothetical protein
MSYLHAFYLENESEFCLKIPENPSDSFFANMDYDPLEGPSWLYDSADVSFRLIPYSSHLIVVSLPIFKLQKSKTVIKKNFYSLRNLFSLFPLINLFYFLRDRTESID